MPEQPPPDDQPTTPDLPADPARQEQTVPMPGQPVTPPPPAGTYASTYPAPGAAPGEHKRYTLSRSVLGAAAAGVLLVGGLAGYAIGVTVVANDSPDRGPSRVDWRGDFPDRGEMPGPQGGFGVRSAARRAVSRGRGRYRSPPTARTGKRRNRRTRVSSPRIKATAAAPAPEPIRFRSTASTEGVA